MSDQFKVRDARKKGYFTIDNELLDIYGGKSDEDKGIGVYAIGVYTVLARYADNDTQKAYPSYNTVARILGISRTKVIESINLLEQRGLIAVTQHISHEKGKPTTNNVYTLLDLKQYPSTHSVPGGTQDVPGVVHTANYPSAPEVPYKDLDKKTNYKNTVSRATPVKSEAFLIEDYFTQKATKGLRPLSPIDREEVNALVKQGFTLERCKPGIDKTFEEFAQKGKAVGTFKLCVASIVQLDPDNKPEPASFTSYQQRNNYGRPRAGTPEYDNYMKAVDF